MPLKFLKAIVMLLLIVYSAILHLWLQLFLKLHILSQIFWAGLSEKFLLEILGFLSPKLDTNNHFKMTKDSVS